MTSRSSLFVRIAAPLTAVGLAVAIGACSSDTLSSNGGQQLTAQGQAGLDVATAKGCTNCHSTSGRASTGPTWQGIWGSEVELTDGRTVVVDEAYIRRSIEDPRSEEVAGFASSMPELALTDDEIARITDLIRELGPAPQGSP